MQRMRGRVLREVKERLDGTVKARFSLEHWLTMPAAGEGANANMAVGRWLATEDAYGLKKGSYSWGVWWRDENLGIYRIHNPDHALRAYRIDVLSMQNLTDDQVHFRDLLLDAYVYPRDGGTCDVEFEDEDEVAAAVAAGHMTAAQHAICETAKQLLQNSPHDIVAKTDQAIRDAIAAKEFEASGEEVPEWNKEDNPLRYSLFLAKNNFPGPSSHRNV